MNARAALREPATQERLKRFIAEASGATSVEIDVAAPLSGGAIQENWRLDLAIADGSHAGRHELVLRTDAPSAIALSRSRAEEFALLKLAYAAGVTVPEPLWLCTDAAVLGRSFYLMRRMPGIAAGHRIVREQAMYGEVLAERLGQELARIHAVTPETIGTFAPGDGRYAFLGPPPRNPAMEQIGLYRGCLDALGEARPALEWGLRWLELNAPATGEIALLHQDFRTGNYLVADGVLAAILDWEFAGWGDPMADLGWFCAKCWRFGAVDKEAGGIAPRAPFYRGYASISGRDVDDHAVLYWEAMAHVRWAVVALQQAERHISGREPSLELALTGRLVPELELEIVNLTDRLAATSKMAGAA